MKKTTKGDVQNWQWEQGRMAYLQYDVLIKVARFVTESRRTRDGFGLIRDETGLKFPPATYDLWRNYSRIFKLCLLVSEENDKILSTPVARRLAQSGQVTCDEYLHFLVEATTAPCPAFRGWKDFISSGQPIRYPLCFSLKYLLAKFAYQDEPSTPIDEVIGAYIDSKFSGEEDNNSFQSITGKERYGVYEQIGKKANKNNRRQARESLKFISQISYLHSDNGNLIVSLSQTDAEKIFNNIRPLPGERKEDGNLEIQRLASSFKDAIRYNFEYKTTIVLGEIKSGFSEGNKVKRTHIITERNSGLRTLFFKEETNYCL